MKVPDANPSSQVYKGYQTIKTQHQHPRLYPQLAASMTAASAGDSSPLLTISLLSSSSSFFLLFASSFLSCFTYVAYLRVPSVKTAMNKIPNTDLLINIHLTPSISDFASLLSMMLIL